MHVGMIQNDVLHDSTKLGLKMSNRFRLYELVFQYGGRH